MRRLGFIFIGIFTLLFTFGCSYSVGDNDKEKLLSVLENNNIIEKGLKNVGTSKVHTSSIDATPIYKHYDVYEKNGEYYSFNFEKIFMGEKNNKKCDYLVTIYDDVQFLKNQSVSQYNENKMEYEKVIKDVYETNVNSYKKYCINEQEKLFGLIKKYVVENYD